MSIRVSSSYQLILSIYFLCKRVSLGYVLVCSICVSDWVCLGWSPQHLKQFQYFLLSQLVPTISNDLQLFSRHKTERFESYCQRLGYSRQLSQDAIRRLGPSAPFNDLLECVIQMEKKRSGQKWGYWASRGFASIKISSLFVEFDIFNSGIEMARGH